MQNPKTEAPSEHGYRLRVSELGPNVSWAIEQQFKRRVKVR
jgi:hypothetical protein